jgi:hypothetical protein
MSNLIQNAHGPSGFIHPDKSLIINVLQLKNAHGTMLAYPIPKSFSHKHHG